MQPTDATFLRLLRANEGRLRRLSRVYGRDTDDQNDLYQEMLVALWRSLPSFRGDAKVSTWLYRVALNTALSHRRRQVARKEVSLEDRPADWRDTRPRADERLAEKENVARLYAAIGRLGGVDKALIMMYLDDRSYREMSEVLGLSETNVGVKLHRIRHRLSSWLTQGVG